MQSIESKVLQRIYGRGRGSVHTQVSFSDLGQRDTVDKTLKTLTDRGTLRRLAKGLYDYPMIHPKLGPLTPPPETIAKALAGGEAMRIQPSGAYAANLLGLSLQVPANVEFLTDGNNRKVEVGNQTITLKRTTPKNMATAGRISGLVIQALRYLGQSAVDETVVRKLAAILSDKDRNTLKRDLKYAPAWIAKIMRQLADGA
ncbi:MAG: hypothetical protein H6824_16145 [Planctomycetaceae bacterium]|nr:hypothetical protein [Planctomycetaceae bacterium]